MALTGLALLLFVEEEAQNKTKSLQILHVVAGEPTGAEQCCVCPQGLLQHTVGNTSCWIGDGVKDVTIVSLGEKRWRKRG